jgi:hypothetical protein
MLAVIRVVVNGLLMFYEEQNTTFIARFSSTVLINQVVSSYKYLLEKLICNYPAG